MLVSADTSVWTDVITNRQYSVQSASGYKYVNVPVEDLTGAGDRDVHYSIAVRTADGTAPSDHSEETNNMPYRCTSYYIDRGNHRITSVAELGSNVRIRFAESVHNVCRDVAKVKVDAWRGTGSILDTQVLNDRDLTSSLSSDSTGSYVEVPSSAIEDNGEKVYFYIYVTYDANSVSWSARSDASSSIDIRANDPACAKPPTPSVLSPIWYVDDTAGGPYEKLQVRFTHSSTTACGSISQAYVSVYYGTFGTLYSNR